VSTESLLPIGVIIGALTVDWVLRGGARTPAVVAWSSWFAIAVAVEISQRYHVPWLDALRASRLGALVLGQGFLWSDIVCYAVGVTLAAVLDGILAARRRAVTGAWPPRDRRG
jgi:hypothetical protein